MHVYFDASTTPTAEELYNASQSSTKGDDFRVVYDNATQLDRYVRRFTSSEIDVWFQTQTDISPSTSDDSYQLYYGNASPGSPPGDINVIMAPPNDANTVGLWHFQEGSGSIVSDSSGRGHDGTVEGSATWLAEGKWGPCLSFDGADSNYINAGNSSDFNFSNFTVEAWIYRDPSWTSSGRIASRWKQFGSSDPTLWIFEMKNDEPYFWAEAGVPWFGGGHVPANVWTHVAATLDDSTMKVYVNGVEKASHSHTESLGGTSGPLALAGRLKASYQHIRVSNVARTSFPYAQFGRITDEPSTAAGSAILPPGSGSPNLVVQGINAYPVGETLDGGLIVQAVVCNEGDAPTTNGFYTDLYADHLPTGAGDYTDSVRFWIASSVEASATITLTTVLTDVTGVSGLSAAALGPLGEASVTLYTQADSSGVVSETEDVDNISAGLDVCIANPDAYENAATLSNMLINGSFEDGDYAPDAAPAAWTRDAWDWSAATFTWDDTQAHDGGRSVRITNDDVNDARWIQTVSVQSDTDYTLSGWVKTENITHTTEWNDVGANLSIYDTWDHTDGLLATNDWTYVSMIFNSGDNTEVIVAARLGHWSGTTTGTAWFDDLRLEPLYAPSPGDDIPANAQPIAPFEAQHHNFSGLSDQDWVKFTAQGGMTYTIRTSNLGPAADTYLYLYDTDGSTLLAANDDYGGSLASRIEWTAPMTGTYYVLVKHWNPGVAGCGTAYDLTMMWALTNKVFLPVIFKSR